MSRGKRIALELLVGGAAILLLVLYLHFRRGSGRETVSLDSPSVKKSLASRTSKVLLIGVDGMTWDIALPLINQGRMPNLERLVKQGAHGMMRAEPPLISPAIWTTIATGVPREVHGIDNFMAKLPFEYTEVPMTSRFRKVPALWEMASREGLSVGVVNWFAASPAEPLRRGVFVAEEIAPGKVKPHHVYPREWLERIQTLPLPRFLKYEKALARIRDSRVDKVYDQDRMAFAAALEIMRELKPDLMMVYFQGVDVLSHGFWKYRFPVGLDYYFKVSPAEIARYREVIELHYELVDRMIGGLLGEAEGYTVLILSDHGHGPTYPPKNIFCDLNKLLERMGLLKYDGLTCDQVLAELAERGELEIPDYRATNIFHACQELEAETARWRERGAAAMDPAAIAGFLAARFHLKPAPNQEAEQARQELMARLAGILLPDRQRQDIDWTKTKVWNIQDFHKQVRGLYLNLVGREPEGVVPLDDYYSFRRQVVKRLKNIRTEQGRRLFKKVRANPDKEVMPFREADPPDILVEVDREALLDNYGFRGPGDRDPIPLPALRWSYGDVSGDHVREGVFALSGEKASTFNRMDVTDLEIAPTVLWILGLPLGLDMPGEPLRRAFEEESAKREPLYIKSWASALPRQSRRAPSPSSSARKKQFKALGYIQ